MLPIGISPARSEAAVAPDCAFIALVCKLTGLVVRLDVELELELAGALVVGALEEEDPEFTIEAIWEFTRSSAAPLATLANPVT